MRSKFLIILSSLALLYSLAIALLFINQLPLEHHAFRQTQTALTAYWLKVNGFSFQYETPVFGFPWSIPMEFPIYQLLVAYISTIFNLPLDPVGRGLSYFFLIACLLPIYSINKSLKLPLKVLFFFIPIFLTQPIYLYWGRAFMIETAALFFSLMSVSLFLDCLRGKYSIFRLILLFTFASLGLLQKITTALPILLVTVLAFLYAERAYLSNIKKSIKDSRLIFVGMTLFFAVITAYLWVQYSDAVKWARGWDGVLTSQSLNAWNWGDLEQRFSYALWIKVIGGRIFTRNLGAVIGLGLIFYLFYSSKDARLKQIGCVLLAMALIPLAMFTNLHIVHDYYQVANIVFLTYLVALSFPYAVLPKYGDKWAYGILTLLVTVNCISGFKYINLMRLSFDGNNRDIAIGQMLNRGLTLDQQFVAFGNDWSSTFTYLAERKSFTAPTWFKDYQGVIQHPENYVERGKLGAIVSCTSEGPTLEQIFLYKLQGSETKVAEVNGCFYVSKLAIHTPKDIVDSRCDGEIDDIKVVNSNGRSFLKLDGWVISGESSNNYAQEEIYLQLKNSFGQKNYLELTRIPSLEINARLKKDQKFNYGISVISSLHELGKGAYIGDLVYKSGNQYLSCGLTKKIEIK